MRPSKLRSSPDAAGGPSRRGNPIGCVSQVAATHGARDTPGAAGQLYLTTFPLIHVSRLQWIGLHDSAVQGILQFTSGADATWYLATNPWAPQQPSHSNVSNGLVEHFAHVTNWTAALPLNDYADGLATSPDGLPIWGCCEAAALPLTDCPPGFYGPDASGYCYNTLTTPQGYTWSNASSACRALGYGASLASIADATTATSVLTNTCGGTLTTGYAFW